jgi:hypothetical protein
VGHVIAAALDVRLDDEVRALEGACVTRQATGF